MFVNLKHPNEYSLLLFRPQKNHSQSKCLLLRTACMTAATVVKVRIACVPPSPRMFTHAPRWESISVVGDQQSVVRGSIFFSIGLWQKLSCLTHSLAPLPPQANSVHLARKAQYMATTWPRAIALANPLARLTTLARPHSHQWMAAVALRELTWTKTRNAFHRNSATATMRTRSFGPERLFTKMATHGKHTGGWDVTVSISTQVVKSNGKANRKPIKSISCFL